MIKFLKLTRCFLSMNIKKILEYRTDFIIGIIPSIISSLFGLIFISLIFNNIGSLTGLAYYDCEMIYGFFILCSSLERVVFGNFQQLRGYIFNGTLDLICTRPLNLILHISLLSFDEDNLVQFVIGIIIVSHSIISKGITISFITVALLIYVSVLGFLLLSSITIATSSFYFLSGGTFSFFNAVNSLTSYLKYPLTIFGKNIRFVLTWILPLSIISYLPMSLVNNPSENFIFYTLYSTVIITLIFLFSIKLFFIGAEKYQSTGN